MRLRAARLLALVPLLLGALSLYEHVAGRDLGIDDILFEDPMALVRTGHPARMAPYTAVLLMLSGSALFLFELGRIHHARAMRWLGTAQFVLALFVLFGTGFDARSMQSLSGSTGIAPYTVIALLALSLGMLGLQWSRAPTTVVVAAGEGGLLARRLLPAAILLPSALGWLLLQGAGQGFYGVRDFAAVTATLTLSGLVILVWRLASALQRRDQMSRRVTERLRRSELMLNRIEEITRVGGWETDLASGQTRWSQEMYRIYELAPDGDPGVFERSMDLYVPHDRERFRAAIAAAREQGLDWELDAELRTARGATRWVHVSGRAEREDGRIARIRGYVSDITERKRAETLTRELADIVEFSDDAIIRMDLDATITRWNAGAQRMFGYSAAEAVGQSMQMLVPPERRGEMEDAIGAACNVGHAGSHDTVRLARDGRRIEVSLSVFAIRNEAGAVVAASAIARDISQQKQAERAALLAHTHLRRIVDANLIGVIIANADGRVVEANDYYLQLIGYSQAELRAGMVNWRTATPAQWLPVSDNALAELHRFGSSRPYQKEYQRRDGSWVTVYVAAALLPGATDQIAAVVLDISEREAAEREIRELNATLEQRIAERTQALEMANREMEAFAYSVSHDLRAPLRAIDGFSQILEEDYAGRLDAEGCSILQRVRAAAQQMGKIIDALLGLSRLTRQSLSCESVDLAELARTIAAELAAAEPAQRRLFELPEKLPAWCDRALATVLLRNLLDNAWKFTSGCAAPRIELGQIRQGAQRVYFVRDNGAGFDMAHAAQLFQPFHRLHAVSEFPGTGIGLATVRRIVERHGGRIWAEGAVGQGATFYFTLPAEPSVVAPTPPSEPGGVP